MARTLYSHHILFPCAKTIFLEEGQTLCSELHDVEYHTLDFTVIDTIQLDILDAFGNTVKYKSEPLFLLHFKPY